MKYPCFKKTPIQKNLEHAMNVFPPHKVLKSVEAHIFHISCLSTWQCVRMTPFQIGPLKYKRERSYFSTIILFWSFT